MSLRKQQQGNNNNNKKKQNNNKNNNNDTPSYEYEATLSKRHQSHSGSKSLKR